MDLKAEIGKRIMAERKRLNISREQFAEKVGLSAYFVGQIERGARGMSFNTLIKIAEYLRVSTDYLLKGETKSTAADRLSRAVDCCTPKERDLIADIAEAVKPYLDIKD